MGALGHGSMGAWELVGMGAWEHWGMGAWGHGSLWAWEHNSIEAKSMGGRLRDEPKKRLRRRLGSREGGGGRGIGAGGDKEI